MMNLSHKNFLIERQSSEFFPVFVTGYPRSGTTLLYNIIFDTLFCDKRDEISASKDDHAFETAFAFFSHPGVLASNIAAQPWPPIKDAISSSTVQTLDDITKLGPVRRVWEAALSRLVFSDAHIPSRSMELDDLHTREPLPYGRHFRLRRFASKLSIRTAQLRLYADALAQGTHPPRLLDKYPFHLLKAPELSAAFPNCTFVHISRDPVDVFASLRRRLEVELRSHAPAGAYSWMTMPATAFVRDWNRFARCAVTAKRHLGPSFIHLTYEDLTRMPGHALAGVAQRLGVPFHFPTVAVESPDERRRFRFSGKAPQPNPSRGAELLNRQDLELIRAETSDTIASLHGLT